MKHEECSVPVGDNYNPCPEGLGIIGRIKRQWRAWQFRRRLKCSDKKIEAWLVKYFEAKKINPRQVTTFDEWQKRNPNVYAGGKPE